jgi:hypothetical protein
MNCRVCGATNETAAVYCYRCGSALRPPGEQPPPATGRTTALAGDERVSTPAEDRAAPGGSGDWAGDVSSAQPLSPSMGGRDPALAGARVYNTPRSMPSTPIYIGPAPVTTQTSTLAVLALILGILSWSLLPFVGSIGAVITGHMGRREIREAEGRLTGQGLATAGLILGYISLALSLLIFVGFCVIFLGLASLGQ